MQIRTHLISLFFWFLNLVMRIFMLQTSHYNFLSFFSFKIFFYCLCCKKDKFKINSTSFDCISRYRRQRAKNATFERRSPAKKIINLWRKKTRSRITNRRTACCDQCTTLCATKTPESITREYFNTFVIRLLVITTHCFAPPRAAFFSPGRQKFGRKKSSRAGPLFTYLVTAHTHTVYLCWCLCVCK